MSSDKHVLAETQLQRKQEVLLTKEAVESVALHEWYELDLYERESEKYFQHFSRLDLLTS